MNILLYIYCAEQVQKCRIGDIVSKRSKANGKERISAFYIASQQYHFTLYMQSFPDLNHFESALLYYFSFVQYSFKKFLASNFGLAIITINVRSLA